MTLRDQIVEAIWEGFQAWSSSAVDREMDWIDTKGTYDALDMGIVADHVIAALQHATRDPDQANTWQIYMSSLLGKKVSVTIDREPELVTVTGTLMWFDEGGEVALRGNDGFIRYSWPNLDTTAL